MINGFFVSSGESDIRAQEKLETKVWDPNNQLKDAQIDQFLVVARLVNRPLSAVLRGIAQNKDK